MINLNNINCKGATILTSKYWKRCLFSILIVFVFFVILYITRPLFLGIGDVNMMKNYTGYRTGTLDANHPYGHVFIGNLMIFLYEYFPSVPWFPLYNIGLLILSFSIVLKVLLLFVHSRKITLSSAMIVFLVLFYTIFVHSLIEITYTYVSACVGVASIALLFSLSYEESKKIKVFEFVLSCFLIILSAIVRYSVFKVIICFWFLVEIFLILRNFGKQEKNFILQQVILIIFTLCGCVYSHNFYMNFRQTYEPENYFEYNEARVRFMDYEIAPFYENIDLYQSIGWNYDLFVLTDYYYFMDENYNTENLKKIVDYSNSIEHDNQLMRTLSCGKNTVLRDPQGFLFTSVMFISIMLVLLNMIMNFNKYNFVNAILPMCALCGTIIMSFYLSYNGRFPFRTYFCVSLPTIIISIYAWISIDKKETSSNFKNKIIIEKSIFSLILCICVLLLAKSYKIIYDERKIKDIELSNSNCVDIANYALTNKCNVYIYDTTVSGDYRLNIPATEDPPTNLIMWGGTNMFNNAFYNQLSTICKDFLTSESWFDDDVYYVTKSAEGNNRRNTLIHFLNEKYGPIECVEIEKINSYVSVYKFLKKI